MGRYGHYNNPSYSRHNNFKVNKDFDSSDEQQEETERQSVISRISGNLKERYQKYNSDEARELRENRRFDKRQKTINDLNYNAKKEGLKAQIRKSKQTAPTNIFGVGVSQSRSTGRGKSSSNPEGTIHYPKPSSYGNMDRLFGIGTPHKTARVSAKKPASNWNGFDKMFGLK